MICGAFANLADEQVLVIFFSLGVGKLVFLPRVKSGDRDIENETNVRQP
jgi:hypothetical protein